jgi:hypothetical protein
MPLCIRTQKQPLPPRGGLALRSDPPHTRLYTPHTAGAWILVHPLRCRHARVVRAASFAALEASQARWCTPLGDPLLMGGIAVGAWKMHVSLAPDAPHDGCAVGRRVVAPSVSSRSFVLTSTRIGWGREGAGREGGSGV